MDDIDWPRVVYLGIWLAVLIPAYFIHRRRGGRFWRDLTIWTALAGAAVIAYFLFNPAR